CYAGDIRQVDRQINDQSFFSPTVTKRQQTLETTDPVANWPIGLSSSLQVPESCTNSPLPNPDGYDCTLISQNQAELIAGWWPHIHHGHGWNKDKYGTSRIREKPMEYRQIHVGVYPWAEPVSTGHGVDYVSTVYEVDKPPTPSQAPPGSSGIGPLSSL
ncbi:uncharacterized protein FSUBG_5065, partial [Fusarium subglutinans]